MNLRLIVFAVFAIAVMVVGIIEWLKAGIPKMPGWTPWVLSLVGCIGLALITSPLIGLNGWWFAVLGFLSLAVTELCYQTIVQGVKGLAQAAVNAAEAKLQQPQVPPKV